MNSTESETITAQQPEPGETQTETQPRIAKPAPETEVTREDRQVSTSQEKQAAEAGELPQPFTGELSYTCLLIPRFHDHYLTGDITDCLVEWMRQICISYGWRLDAIVIRPGYLQWVMSVPLNANPAQFMRTVRQQTSQKIFDDFPRYKQKNLSGQFWAPGNLVMPGNQLLTMEIINSFILQTRRQQGIT